MDLTHVDKLNYQQYCVHCLATLASSLSPAPLRYFNLPSCWCKSTGQTNDYNILILAIVIYVNLLGRKIFYIEAKKGKSCCEYTWEEIGRKTSIDINPSPTQKYSLHSINDNISREYKLNSTVQFN